MRFHISYIINGWPSFFYVPQLQHPLQYSSKAETQIVSKELQIVLKESKNVCYLVMFRFVNCQNYLNHVLEILVLSE